MIGPVRLNLACGGVKLWPGFENSDVEPFSNANDVRRVDLDEPLPYAAGSVDLVMMSHGLNLRPDKGLVLHEIARVLRPGGWLRLDENPTRFPFSHDDPVDVAGYPLSQRWLRAELVGYLERLGLACWEHEPEFSVIPTDSETAEALVGNHAGHVSFAIEARKL